MKLRLILALLVMVFFAIPGIVMACGFDDYGYNENARLFDGSFDNWEAFITGQPPLPTPSPSATDVLFVKRKWSKEFDNTMFHGKPPQAGAWCASYFHKHLSGEKLGWIWHEFFVFAYSSEPLPNAVPVEGMPDYYFIRHKVWLTDPAGTETIEKEASLSGADLPKGKSNRIRGLLNRDYRGFFN